MLSTILAHDAAWKEKIETRLKESGIGDVLSNSAAEPVARTAACIRLAGTMENRTELLVKLLETRTRKNPDAFASFGYLGNYLRNIEQGSDPNNRHSADWHWMDKSAPDLKIEFLNSSGHWKINTILDPALRPWNPGVAAPVSAPPASAPPASSSRDVSPPGEPLSGAAETDAAPKFRVTAPDQLTATALPAFARLVTGRTSTACNGFIMPVTLRFRAGGLAEPLPGPQGPGLHSHHQKGLKGRHINTEAHP